MRRIFILVFVLAFGHSTLRAFDFSEHPEFTAVPGYKQVFEEMKPDDHILFPITHWDHHDVQGKKIFRQYKFDASLGTPQKSNIGILRYYYDLVRNQGGKPVHKEKAFASYRTTVNGVKLCLVVEAYHGGESYSLTLVEVTNESGTTSGPPEPVTANAPIKAEEIMSKLNAEGHIAMYFTFESGEEKPTSDAGEVMSQIARMLKDNPTLRLRIEGHTDNVGTAEKNKDLSARRAMGVRDALVRLGVPLARLEAVGMGQEYPIAPNTTEDGRNKNRRVELVKLK